MAADPIDEFQPRAFDPSQVDTMPIVLPSGMSLWEWADRATA
jgi:hypothetical protein